MTDVVCDDEVGVPPVGRPRPDSYVIEAAHAGDANAWELLFRDLYPRLRPFIARRVPPDEIEDAVNETMARAISGIGTAKLNTGSVDAWIFGIARNVAADSHRRAYRRNQRQAELAPSTFGGWGVTSPEESALVRDDYWQMRVAFEHLRPDERELLELRVVGELSVEETARVLRKSPGAVRTAQSRALSRLRCLMEKCDV